MAGETPAQEKPVGFNIIDPRGTWFRSNSYFDIEDPTAAWKAKGAAPLPRFVPGAYTQATPTAWTEAQWRAGVLTKFSGRPGDDGVKEVPYVVPVAAVAAAVVTAAAGANVNANKPLGQAQGPSK